MILDGAMALFYTQIHAQDGYRDGGLSLELTTALTVSVDQASSKYSLSAIMLIRDMCSFARGESGSWIKGGVNLPRLLALDFLYDIISHWRFLFQQVHFFRALLAECIIPAIKPLVKRLQQDHVLVASHHGPSIAATFTSRACKLVRCLLLNYCSSDLFADMEFFIVILVHSLQPDRTSTTSIDDNELSTTSLATGPPSPSSPSFSHHHHSITDNLVSNMHLQSSAQYVQEHTLKSRWDEASSVLMHSSAASFLSRFTTAGVSSGKAAGGGGNSSSSNLSSNKGLGGSLGIKPFSSLISSSNVPFFTLSVLPSGGVSLPSSSSSLLGMAGGYTASTSVPAFPVMCVLEALLSFLLSDLSAIFHHPNESETSPDSKPYVQYSQHKYHLLEILLINLTLGVASFLQATSYCEPNLRELESCFKGSQLLTLLRELLDGIETTGRTPSEQRRSHHVHSQLKSIHDLLHSPGTINGNTSIHYSLLMAMYLLQFSIRLMLTLALDTFQNESPIRLQQHSIALRHIHSSSNLHKMPPRKIFLPEMPVPSVAPFPSPDDAIAVAVEDSLKRCVVRSMDSVYEVTLDLCSVLLDHSQHQSIVQASLDIISELAITAGIISSPSKHCSP